MLYEILIKQIGNIYFCETSGYMILKKIWTMMSSKGTWTGNPKTNQK